jgi:hypothetical protein
MAQKLKELTPLSVETMRNGGENHGAYEAGTARVYLPVFLRGIFEVEILRR